MENQSEQNQQSVLGGQGLQVSEPQAPVIQATESTVTINYGVAPQPEPKITGTPQNLPYSGVIAFVGREQELEQIHAQLQARSTVAISAIAGMGGIGKTELALQYALKHCREGSYPGGLCWLRAREEVGTQIISFARLLLNLTPPDDLELGDKVRWCWGRWQSGEVLLIFDDVQDYADIQSFLPPQESRFKVLMTSRSHFGLPVQELQLDVLSEEKALELLQSLVQDERVDQQLEQSKQLCEWLGYLPLGVELVGRYLFKRKDLLIKVLWERLQEKRLEARAFKQAEPGMTASLGVAAAFELNWQEFDDSTQQLAAVLSLFALVEIPWVLVEQCLPEMDAEELEEIRDQVLLGTHLLKRVDHGMYQLHQLLREFFASKREHRADVEELKRKFYEVVISEAERVKEKPGRSLIKESMVAIAHLEAASSLLRTLGKEVDLATCLFWIAELYQILGRYSEAIPLYQKTLKIQQRNLGEEHPTVATSLNNLAGLCYALGRYNEVEAPLQKVLIIRRGVLGDKHPSIAETLNDLAVLYSLQERYDEAELLYKSALALRRELLGNEHLDVAKSLNNLAYFYASQGLYYDAELLYRDALAIMYRLFTGQHPEIATILNNLGMLHYSQGNYDQAEPLYQEALALRQQLFGKKHPAVATSLNNLGALCYSQGRYGEAEPLYQEALLIRQLLLGEQHSAVAQSFSNLAKLYYAQGCYNKAETLYVKALSIAYETLGEVHSWTQHWFINFRSLLQNAIQENRTDELSDEPMTRSLLQELQSSSD